MPLIAGRFEGYLIAIPLTKLGVRFCCWEGFPNLDRVLPMFTVLFLFVDAGTQLPIPPSTQERLATTARVEALTQSDLLNLESEAQAGHAAVEHLLALLYEEGRLLPKDLAAAWNKILLLARLSKLGQSAPNVHRSLS